jgi:hypothetical protein
MRTDFSGDPTETARDDAMAFLQGEVSGRFAERESCVSIAHRVNMRRRMIVVDDYPKRTDAKQRGHCNLSVGFSPSPRRRLVDGATQGDCAVDVLLRAIGHQVDARRLNT